MNMNNASHHNNVTTIFDNNKFWFDMYVVVFQYPLLDALKYGIFIAICIYGSESCFKTTL